MKKTSELAGNTESWAKSLKKKVWGESAQEAVKDINTQINILELQTYKTESMIESLKELGETIIKIQITKESSGINLEKLLDYVTVLRARVQATRNLKNKDDDVNAEFKRLYQELHDESSWFNLSMLADIASLVKNFTFMDNIRQAIQILKDNGIIIGAVGGVCLLGFLSMTPLGATVKEITTRIVIPTTIYGGGAISVYILVSLTRTFTSIGMIGTMYQLSTIMTMLRIPGYKDLADIDERSFITAYKLAMENIPNILKSEGVTKLSSLSVNTAAVKDIPGMVDNFNNIVAVYQLKYFIDNVGMTVGTIVGAITLYLAYDKFGNIKCWWGKTEAPVGQGQAPVAPALAPAQVVAPPAAPAVAPAEPAVAPAAPAVAQRVVPAVAQRVVPAVAQRVVPAVVEDEGALDLGLPDGEEIIGDDMEGGEKKMKRSYGTKKTKSKKTKSKKTKSKKMKTKKIHNKKKGVHKSKKGGRNKIIKPAKIHKKSMRSVKK